MNVEGWKKNGEVWKKNGGFWKKSEKVEKNAFYGKRVNFDGKRKIYYQHSNPKADQWYDGQTQTEMLVWFLRLYSTCSLSYSPPFLCVLAEPMQFESHFKSSFGNVEAFNLKKLKLTLSPLQQWQQVALRMGGDNRQVPRQDRLWI